MQRLSSTGRPDFISLSTYNYSLASLAEKNQRIDLLSPAEAPAGTQREPSGNPAEDASREPQQRTCRVRFRKVDGGSLTAPEQEGHGVIPERPSEPKPRSP